MKDNLVGEWANADGTLVVNVRVEGTTESGEPIYGYTLRNNDWGFTVEESLQTRGDIAYLIAGLENA